MTSAIQSNQENIDPFAASFKMHHQQPQTPPQTPPASPTTAFKLEGIQAELQEQTLKYADQACLLGTPEVLALGSYLIKQIKGERVLDIGTYTGASALAWAIATPKYGQVWTFDVDQTPFIRHGLPIIRKAGNLLAKLIPIEGQALNSLDGLLSSGREETFDFAFIDADKANYPGYYEKCLQLLRKGGVMLIDMALHRGVGTPYGPEDSRVKAVDYINRMVTNDSRTASYFLNCGDGIHVAFKL